jgi:hypothetical protein
LDAMRAVVGPGPARPNELAGRDHRGVADEGDEIALATGFDPQHAESWAGRTKASVTGRERRPLLAPRLAWPSE